MRKARIAGVMPLSKPVGTAWGRHVEELALNSNLNHRGHITEKK